MLLVPAVRRVYVLSLLVACSEASPPDSYGRHEERSNPPDAGAADDGPPLCGLSFAQAVATFAPERVCPTWVYRVAEADCVDWGPCS